MRKMFAILFVFFICMPLDSFSETRYFPLPELIGEYYGATPVTRTASFAIGTVPALIREARISLVGGASTGILQCPDEITLMPREFSWFFELDATMDDLATGGLWIAGGIASSQTGPFEILEEFRPIWHAGWTFLNDGRGEVNLRVVPTGYIAECMPIEIPQVAIVTQAYLMLDGDFLVPIERTSWGQIKALYENDE